MKVINVQKFREYLTSEIDTCDELCAGFRELKEDIKAVEYGEDASVFRDLLEIIDNGSSQFFEEISTVTWHDLEADPYDLPDDDNRLLEVVLKLPGGYDQIRWNSRTKLPSGAVRWAYVPQWENDLKG